MVNIYRNKNAFDISSIIIDNESFFKNNISAKKLGKQSLDLMKQIDGAVLLDAGLGTIRTPYGITSIRSLSTGCKTVLNYLFILTHKKEYACVKAIDATECGWNAIEELFKIAESRESKIGIIIEHNNGLFNCSERDFWSIVASIYMAPGTYSIEPLPLNTAKGNPASGGNTTLKGQVSQVMSKVKHGDILFTAFDNIGNTSFFYPSDFIHNTSAHCNRKGVLFYYTQYYCFEEIYLSYCELLRISNSIYKDTLKFVHDCINNNREYFTIGAQDEAVANFIKQSGYHITTKEEFANVLLVEATNKINGHFRISKRKGKLSSKGQCWVQDCKRIQRNIAKQQIDTMCSNQYCKYICKQCAAKKKMEHLRKNSIFRNNLVFNN